MSPESLRCDHWDQQDAVASRVESTMDDNTPRYTSCTASLLIDDSRMRLMDGCVCGVCGVCPSFVCRFLSFFLLWLIGEWKPDLTDKPD